MHEGEGHVSEEFLMRRKFWPRERQILRLAATGYDINSIADKLGVTPQAIDLYLRNIRIKTSTIGTKDKSTPIFMQRALELGVINKEEILESCNPDGFSLLSDREKEVMRRIGKGLTQAEIANELFFAERTIRQDTLNIRRKTGLKGKHHIVAVSLVIPETYLAPPKESEIIIPLQRSTETTIYNNDSS